jgi:redox-sensitive bicupin YhaK (pirin superfamily)
MLIEERSRDIGSFLVGRLLPFRLKRQVGPFTFIDHMGPSTIGPTSFIDVDQHPHIGLSTLTYLFEGEIEHRDSTGAIAIIKPGDVGFMTSGKGVTHTERTPSHLRNGQSHKVHGYQVWVALPKEKEEMKPRFDFVPKTDVPNWSQNGLELCLVAGEAFGKKSPLKVYSHLFMVSVLAKIDAKLNIREELRGEIAFVIVTGSVQSGEESIEAGQMLISKVENECEIELEKGTQILIFGGDTLPEERFLKWNFVSSSKERLNKAETDWKAKLFPKVPGDETYIPFPS